MVQDIVEGLVDVGRFEVNLTSQSENEPHSCEAARDLILLYYNWSKFG